MLGRFLSPHYISQFWRQCYNTLHARILQINSPMDLRLNMLQREVGTYLHHLLGFGLAPPVHDPARITQRTR